MVNPARLFAEIVVGIVVDVLVAAFREVLAAYATSSGIPDWATTFILVMVGAVPWIAMAVDIARESEE